MVVLYDADCGFCRFCVARLLDWDVRERLRPLAIQSPEGQRLLDGMDPQLRLASAHVVDDHGRIRSGGAAVESVAGALPFGAPAAWLAHRAPGATDRGYRWVAGHRVGLSRWVPSRFKRAAGERIARRERPSASA